MSLVGIQPIFILSSPFSSSLTVYKYDTAVSMQTCCLMELYPVRALIYVYMSQQNNFLTEVTLG